MFRSLPAKDLVGQIGCWTYFQSIDSVANKTFLANFQSWLKSQSTAISNANDQVAQLRQQLTASNNLGF